MTWVIGAIGSHDRVVGVSDIQVMWGNQTEDCLQKLHHVGPYMVYGFSGSVELGFMMLDDLKEFLRVNEAQERIAWKPDWVAWKWHKRARAVFHNARKELKEKGCNIILLGVYPNEDPKAPPSWDGLPYIIVMNGPKFVPACHEDLWGYYSIGLGRSHYAEEIEDIKSMETDPLAHFVDGNGNIVRTSLNIPIAAIFTALREKPVVGVSKDLHICIIQNGKVSIEGHSVEAAKVGFRITRKRFPVASSWKEFQAICATRNQNTSQAVC